MKRNILFIILTGCVSILVITSIFNLDNAMYTIQCIEGHDIMKIYKIDEDIYEVKSLTDGNANLKSKKDVFELTTHAYYCEKKKPIKRMKLQ